MTHHNDPPFCDPACVKIILNSGRVARESELIAQLVKNGLVKLSPEDKQLLINILDQAEDRLIEFNNRVLAGTGYERKTEKFKLEE